MHGPSNGFRPAGDSLPKPRSERISARAASSAPSISDSIVIPEARDRLFEVFERFQMPDEVKSTLEGSISGDLRLQTALFDAMVDTWPRLAKNIGEVKRAVRKAPWKIAPWARRGEKPTPKAEALAKDVENLAWGMRPDPKTGLKGFEGTVEELSVGYWYGHGVSEIHWERVKGVIAPRGTMNVPARFYGYPFHTEGLDRLMLDPSGGKQGFMNLVDFPENRFLIGVNGIHRGHPTTAAPLRALVGYWLACIFGLKWFMEYAQRYGQPIRWANYEAGDTTAKNEILKMMELIGSGGYGVFPGTTKLELVESSKGGTSLPQYELLKLADEQCDIFILGQTLTSSQGDKGSQALGNVHMVVRQDVVEGVCDFVGEIMTHQFAPAIVTLNHGTRTDTPGIWAVFEKPKDEKAMAERDNALGITAGKVPVERQWFYERHSIPIPAEGAPLFKEEPDPEPKVDPKTGLPVPPKDGKEKPDEEEDDKPKPGKKAVEAAEAAITWRQFPANSGSLGVPRSEMPQIRSGDRAAMVQFFRKRGITATEETVQADTLKPTQAEFSPEKVRMACDYKGGNRAILVSDDGHVIDGHHQWQASVMMGEDIRIIRLGASVARCLMMAHRMPSTTVAAGLREDLSDDLDVRPKKTTTLEKLSSAVLEGLTGVQAEWLAPVRPFFDKLLAAAMNKTATDEDFQEVLLRAQRELPELFGVLDTEALQEAMETAIGSAMLAGSVERYEK